MDAEKSHTAFIAKVGKLIYTSKVLDIVLKKGLSP